MVKVFQRTMHHQINDYLTEKLSKPIAGSKRNHSTQHCLSCMLRMWKNVLHKGGCIFAIFMGLWKAFDLLNHDLLIAKLEVCAFETDALRYMKSFLKKRKQRVRVIKAFSEWEKITAGPLFFFFSFQFRTTWIFCSRTSNNMSNKLHERLLRSILNDYSGNFKIPLENNNGKCNHPP